MVFLPFIHCNLTTRNNKRKDCACFLFFSFSTPCHVFYKMFSGHKFSKEGTSKQALLNLSAEVSKSFSINICQRLVCLVSITI